MIELKSKVCPSCKKEKELYEFSHNISRKATKGFCNSCNSKYRAPKINPYIPEVLNG